MSSSSADHLVEIPRNEWIKLRDQYKNDWPKNHVGFNILQNYINWFDKDPEIKFVKIYSLNGDWSDGTFIVNDRMLVLFYTDSEDQSRLVTALNLLDKSKKYILYGYNEKFMPAVEKFFNINKWPFQPDGTVWYYLKKEDALKFDIAPTPGLNLKSLEQDEAQTVNEYWPHRHPGSINLIKHLLKYNINIGAYKEDTGELIAWCLRLRLGSLGLLHVKDDFKRHGLGTILVKYMCKKIAENGDDITSPVIIKNEPSRAMFRKLGFEEVDKNYWIDTVASDPGYEWSENE